MVPKVLPIDKTGFSAALLKWYDENARALPWRLGPSGRAQGAVPDPYRVWLSEVMLQQTTVATVIPRFEIFLRRWPDIAALAKAPIADVLGEWAGLGYYARARNLHACAVAVRDQYAGVFPENEADLLRLPGIGQYTAAAISAIAFDQPATVVDGNVDRIIVRQFAIGNPIRAVKADIYRYAGSLTPYHRPGDYAQAMMDLGALICRPKEPKCIICPVRDFCEAHRVGLTGVLPVKPPKKDRPIRFGTVYVGFRKDGAVLTERREGKGLFGGMAGLPGDVWSTNRTDEYAAPYEASWVHAGQAEHTLTHFHLVLTVMKAPVTRTVKPYFWTDDLETLPTVFRKAIAVAKR